MAFQIAEPTLSPEGGNLLESFLGCKIAREGMLPDRKQFDFFLLLDDLKIIIELKVGGFEKLPTAISQGEDYKDIVGADGIIAIVYPEEARKEVTRPEDVIKSEKTFSLLGGLSCLLFMTTNLQGTMQVKHYVEISGTRYPVKQALAQALGLAVIDFTSQDAYRIFRRLGLSLGQI